MKQTLEEIIYYQATGENTASMSAWQKPKSQDQILLRVKHYHKISFFYVKRLEIEFYFNVKGPCDQNIGKLLKYEIIQEIFALRSLRI